MLDPFHPLAKKVLIIVQARMTSTRLPGKVLMSVGGKSLLVHLLDRLAQVKLADAIIVAATTNATDDPIVNLCQHRGVSTYRGSEQDVLSRYYEAALPHQPEIVIRITADCPLLDPSVVDGCIQQFLKSDHSLDYVCTEGFPRGLDCEVFSWEALKTAHAEATHPEAREHVTPYLYRTPRRFRLSSYWCPLPNVRHHRWTIDTPEDFDLASRLLLALPEKDYAYESVLAVLAKHPDWLEINQHIQQVKLSI